MIVRNCEEIIVNSAVQVVVKREKIKIEKEIVICVQIVETVQVINMKIKIEDPLDLDNYVIAELKQLVKINEDFKQATTVMVSKVSIV